MVGNFAGGFWKEKKEKESKIPRVRTLPGTKVNRRLYISEERKKG